MYVDDRVGVSHVDDAVKVQLIAQESLVDVFNGGLIWLKNQSPLFSVFEPRRVICSDKLCGPV